MLRTAAKRCDALGFNVDLGRDAVGEGCGCFVHHLAGARMQLGHEHGFDWCDPETQRPYDVACDVLADVVDGDDGCRNKFSSRELTANGWNNAPKRDVVAAFLIAADIAEAEGQ